MKNKTIERQKSKTYSVMQRIAELKIKAYGLNCTVDEYINICKNQTSQPIKNR